VKTIAARIMNCCSGIKLGTENYGRYPAAYHTIHAVTKPRLCLGIASPLLAQDAGTMTYAAAATSKFTNMAGLPSCMTLSVQRGDPSKGPSVILLKFKPGCTVPWHWHTAAEQLMVVSGTGTPK
jgi:hypothetical protein